MTFQDAGRGAIVDFIVHPRERIRAAEAMAHP
jgi:hypothetical protein